MQRGAEKGHELWKKGENRIKKSAGKRVLAEEKNRTGAKKRGRTQAYSAGTTSVVRPRKGGERPPGSGNRREKRPGFGQGKEGR